MDIPFLGEITVRKKIVFVPGDAYSPDSMTPEG